MQPCNLTAEVGAVADVAEEEAKMCHKYVTVLQCWLHCYSVIKVLVTVLVSPLVTAVSSLIAPLNSHFQITLHIEKFNI